MTSLPDELIATIVDELEQDRESLKACSLVGSSFCAASQRYLFHSMWLHHDAWWLSSRSYAPSYSGETGTPATTIRRLAALFRASPHLAAFVRDLIIEVNIDLTTDEGALAAQILGTARNLESFAISSCANDWNNLPPALQTALLDVIARPSLKHLHLWSIDNIPASAVLGTLASATVLSIFSCTITAHAEHLASSARPVPQRASRLQKLLLTSSEPATYDLILSPRAPRFKEMTKLLLRPNERTRFGAERLLSSLSDTLTHLILDSEGFIAPYSLNFPPLPKLRFVTLRLFRGLAKRYIPDGFAATLTALPQASLTIIVSLAAHSTTLPWPTESSLLGLEDWQMDGPIRCHLRFMNRAETSLRGTYLDKFGVAMRAALPGRELQISTVEEEEWYKY
ncbi:hypothetical protein C8R43DRAFT_952839 [Mycena crocata]|nr:hypothetical protein C8R43DRAFT_952839 [Mycena crocata]